jgi:hypothetical protein
MQRVVLEQRLGFHATVCADGTPNLSPKGTTTVWDDEHLLFADICSPRTVANLRRNPAIEVNVVDPFVRKGYRFKGRAEVHTEGEIYEQGLRRLAGLGYGTTPARVNAIVLVAVEHAAPLVSPAYDSGVSEGEVQARWEAHYRALGSSLRPPEPPLSADGIVLRPLEARDAEAIRAACQDPEIQRWIPAVPSPYTADDARVFVAWSQQGWRTGERASFVICDPESDELLGTVGLALGRSGRGIAAIGYWLTRAARGKGAATAAVKLVSRWAFGELGIERLELYTEPGNEPSQRVAERAGFTREGILRGHLQTRDGRRDSVSFSLLPSDL